MIAKRYLAEAVLGRGGAGEVYRVRDKASGESLALKRLRVAPNEPKHRELALLFEREYHTLAQLAHPNIVAVRDYGVSDGVPYYTMELLDGSDLRELSPLPWQRTCALLCDVASSLALLHSRRLVHRDLSPRNVRCTSDGRAKLIDFGAMAPMGRAGQLIGTPAYVAPELANGQELDGRADLYGLGALAYWTLTGRHAFRARHFSELRDVWRTRPPPPSAFARDVPPDLDALVMALLSLDPAARPSSTAEVSSRLRALSGQPAGDALATAHAYLTTPTLVGRSEEQRLIRRRMLRAVSGTGGSVLIEGAAGSGRSRLLATLVLEAKLAGALVLSVDAAETEAGDFDLLRRLVGELLDAAPDLCREAARPHAAFIAEALPDLALTPVPAAPSAGEVRESLVSFLLDVAHVQPLCLAIDDLPRADAPSAAVIARLAARANGQPLAVAATAETGHSHALVRVLDQLAESGARIALTPLDVEQSKALLRSVFGEVPNLDALSSWIHALSGGRPGSCMELAQHLVDRGIARFADGGWTLAGIDELSLPQSFEQALEHRFAALAPAARRLAELLSQTLPLAPLKLAECLELLAPHSSNAQAFNAVDDLLRAQMLSRAGDLYSLRDPVQRAIIDRGLRKERRTALHLRLAQLYERRGDAQALVAYHSIHGGQWDRGFEIHHALRGRVADISSLNALFGRSETGTAVHESLYSSARERGLSPAQLYPLQKVLVQLAAVCNPSLAPYVDHVLPRLRRDSGLIYWQDCPELLPLERIVHCVKRAQESYENTPESERGLAPVDAIRELAVMAGVLSGLYSRTADAEGMAQLPGLLQPFVPLSPVIGLLHDMIQGAVDAAVYGADVSTSRASVIERLANPVEGLDEMTRQGALHLLSYYQGLDAGIRADPIALRIAEQLDALPSYAPLAAQLRMIYYLNDGDTAAAERARDEREALTFGQFDSDAHLTGGMIYEAVTLNHVGDLVAAQRLVERIGREAERFSGWRLWHAYTRGVFESLRGNIPDAMREVERCIALAPASGHAAQQAALSLQAELLARGGEYRRALEQGRHILATFAAGGRTRNNLLELHCTLALAETECGEYAAGAARLDELIAAREASGSAGLLLAVLYVQRARIALCADDEPAFERYARLAARCNERLRHSGLLARLQQLVADARNADQPVTIELARGADLTAHETVLSTELDASVFGVLDACRGTAERTRRALELLIRESGASGGYLFGVTPHGLRVLAHAQVPEPDLAIERDAAAHFDEARGDDEMQTRMERTDPRALDASELQPNRAPRGLQPFLLRPGRGDARNPNGVVLLRSEDGCQLRLQWDVLSAVCETLMRAGDLRGE